MKRFALCTFIFSFAVSAFAYDATEKLPENSGESIKQLEGLGIDEHLGAQIDLSRKFTNEKGELVPLSTYYDGSKPVLLTMVYYSCPSLCNYHLNGLFETFSNMKKPLGEEFKLVAVSMNHREDHTLAAAKLETYLEELGQPTARGNVHFMVGTEENVKALADEIGFKFRWDPKEQQYAHAAAAYVTTPSGTISKYLYGIEFSAQTLRLAMVEAGQGKVGSIVDQVILFCFQFNPSKNKYTLYSYNIMRAAAGLTVIVLAVLLIPIWRRERKQGS